MSFDHAEDEGFLLGVRGIRAGVIFFVGGAVILGAVLAAALPILAPGESGPLRLADADMRVIAASGVAPLVEAARAEGRPTLYAMARCETYGLLALFGAAALFFFGFGLRNARPRRWTNFFWVASLLVVFGLPAAFPKFTLAMADYAVTSSWERPEAVSDPTKGQSILGVYGENGINRRMSPAAFLVERGVAGGLLAFLLALVFHDLGYRLREFAIDAGFVASTPYEASGGRARGDQPPPRSRTSDRASGPSARSGGFGSTAVVITPEARACRRLGVRSDASRQEIERAYKIAMKRAHPDLGGSAEEAAAVNEARDILLKRP